MIGGIRMKESKGERAKQRDDEIIRMEQGAGPIALQSQWGGDGELSRKKKGFASLQSLREKSPDLTREPPLQDMRDEYFISKSERDSVLKAKIRHRRGMGQNMDLESERCPVKAGDLTRIGERLKKTKNEIWGYH